MHQFEHSSISRRGFVAQNTCFCFGDDLLAVFHDDGEGGVVIRGYAGAWRGDNAIAKGGGRVDPPAVMRQKDQLRVWKGCSDLRSDLETEVAVSARSARVYWRVEDPI